MTGIIRIACVGDSITFGQTLQDRAGESYPARLQEYLGTSYEVRNFGHTGTTLLNNTFLAYTNTDEYCDALDFAADIYIICLGTNDLMPNQYAQNKERFIQDYILLIDSFRLVNPGARILLATIPPVNIALEGYESMFPIWHCEIQTDIRKVAELTNSELVDFEKALDCPEYFSDGVHPNAKGAAVLANSAYQYIINKC